MYIAPFSHAAAAADYKVTQLLPSEGDDYQYRFFIDRPIFAAVLSIVIFVAGAIAIPLLPISEYPEVVPPTVVVQATYPGANPKVIADTVSSPLEEQINGAENMMYMKSVAGSDGVLQMTITFAPGTDPNRAQVDVQNRVSQALSRLPSEVVSLGVTTQKQSPAFLTLITLISEGTYDPLYLRNYANIRVKDQLARIPGVGQIRLFGGGDYAMRVWLDPDKIASRGMTAGDVVRAIQEQNIQVSAGQLGAEPIKGGSDFLIAINAQGRLRTAQEFGEVVLKTGSNGEVVRLSDVARIELGASDYTLRGQLDHYNTSIIGVFQAPGANALATRDAVIAKMDELAGQFPPGVSYRSDYDATIFVRESIAAVIHTLFEAIALVVLVVILFLQTWRASIIPLIEGNRRRHPGQHRQDQGRLCLRSEPAAGPRSRPRRGLFAVRRRPCGRRLRRAPASGQRAAKRRGEDAKHGLSLRWLPVQRATT